MATRTRISTFARVLFGALLGVAVSIAEAHHSFAAYDDSKTLRIEGVVESWRFANPHCALQVRADDGSGHSILWDFEGLPAGMLTPLGYRRNTFEPAARVTVVYNPMRDSKPGGGRLVGAILSDGTSVGQVAPE
jgi:hypothetical protein